MTRVTVTSNAGQIRVNLAGASLSLTREIDLAIGRAAAEVAREAKALSPKAHSVLTNAIIASRLGFGRWLVKSGTEYARYVEEGTGAGGYPPIQSLIDWIKIKRIVPRDPTLSERGLAFAIRRSIGAHGTPAQPYMMPALERKTDRVRSLIEAAVISGLGGLT